MHYYVATHDHNHGTSVVFFKSKTDLFDMDNTDIAKKLDIDYEPENWCEYFDVMEVFPDNCMEIK